jgi:hypothetical protein
MYVLRKLIETTLDELMMLYQDEKYTLSTAPTVIDKTHFDQDAISSPIKQGDSPIVIKLNYTFF